jgi:hypothetical protein
MTTQQNQPPTWGTPPPKPPDAPKARPFKAGFLGCFGVLAAAIVVIIVIATLASDGTDPDSKTKTTTAPAKGPAATATTEAATSYPTPKPADFKLTVKTLSKQCFGEAGCNLTFRVEAGWDATYDPDKTYEVVYEVRGGESGPQVNTMSVTGDNYDRPQEESIGTSSAKRKLTAVVTSVEES